MKDIVEEDTLQEHIHMITVSGGKQEKQMWESDIVIHNFPEFHFPRCSKEKEEGEGA